jgi:hypothetical protein
VQKKGVFLFCTNSRLLHNLHFIDSAEVLHLMASMSKIVFFAYSHPVLLGWVKDLKKISLSFNLFWFCQNNPSHVKNE